MKTKKKEDVFEDDGRTIASMDVDGIRDGLFSYRRKRPEQRGQAEQTEHAEHTSGEPGQKEDREKVQTPLTKEEQKLYRRGVWLAHLVTGLIFIGFFALFLLFCQFVWFS